MLSWTEKWFLQYYNILSIILIVYANKILMRLKTMLLVPAYYQVFVFVDQAVKLDQQYGKKRSCSVLFIHRTVVRDFNSDIFSLVRSIQSPYWLSWTVLIGGTGPSSDAGWGCMLRCGQMMLAQALICRHLGRGEYWCCVNLCGVWRPFNFCCSFP